MDDKVQGSSSMLHYSSMGGRRTTLPFGLWMTFLLFTPSSSSGSDAVPAPCKHLFEEEQGSINLPQNPLLFNSEINCIFDIAKSQDKFCGIRLTFAGFNLEEPDTDGFCKKDWVAVDSCVPEGGSRFCGSSIHHTNEYPFQKNSEAFRLVFHSDNYTNEKDFRIIYQLLDDCSRHQDLFWNPPYNNIPDVFPPDTPCFTQMDCIYEFIRESPFTCGVRMRVLTFELDGPIETKFGGACLDFFHAPGCGFLCGSPQFIWIAKYQPGATSLKFHFHSDEKVSQQGFQIAFEQVYDCL